MIARGGKGGGFSQNIQLHLVMPAPFTVQGSPASSTGTFTVSWSPAPPNTFLVMPSTGESPIFRALQASDIPPLSQYASISHTHNLADLLGNLPISRVTGQIPLEQLPDIPASKVGSGVLDVARLPAHVHSLEQIQGNAVDAGKLLWIGIGGAVQARELTVSDIPLLPYAPIGHGHTFDEVSGQLDVSRVVGTLPAAQIGSHTHEIAHLTAPTEDSNKLLSISSSGAIVARTLQPNDIPSLPYASLTHTHALDEITGVLPTSRITGILPAAQVGSHEHSLADISAATAEAGKLVAVSTTGSLVARTLTPSDIPDLPYASTTHTHAASAITSGVFDIERIPPLPQYAQVGHTHTFAEIDGNLPTSRITGILAGSQLGEHTHTLADVSSTTTDAGKIVAISTNGKLIARDLVPSDIPSLPYAPLSHEHSAAEITSGTLDPSRIPHLPQYAPATHAHTLAQVSDSAVNAGKIVAVVSGGALQARSLTASDIPPLSQYAAASHTHPFSEITGTLSADRITGTIPGSQLGAHTHTLTQLQASASDNNKLLSVNSTGGIVARSLNASDIPSLPYAPVSHTHNLVDMSGDLPASRISGQLSVGQLPTHTHAPSQIVTSSSNQNRFLAFDSTGAGTARFLTAADIPDLSGTYAVTNHTHTSSQISWSAVPANTVFAGPTSGNAAPAFRTLASTDIPDLDASKITSGNFPVSRMPTLNKQVIVRTSTGNYTTGSGVFVNVDATNLSITLSVSSGIVLVGFLGIVYLVAGVQTYFDITVDGVRYANTPHGLAGTTITSGNGTIPVSFVVPVVGLSVGTHVFRPVWCSVYTSVLSAVNHPVVFWAMEII